MKKRAYTLFELLVSISIIGILIAVASVSYGAAQKKARDARRIEDMNAIQKAAEMYYSQKNYVYPSQAELTNSGLLQQWPVDPKGVINPYVYTLSGGTYCACATQDNTTGGNSGSICNFGSATTHYCVKNQQ